MTSSAPERIGTSDFNLFFRSLSEHADLESAYLNSRLLQQNSATQPGINTEAGLLAERDLDVFRNFSTNEMDRQASRADRWSENTTMKLNHIVELAREIKRTADRQWFDMWAQDRNVTLAEQLREGLLQKERKHELLERMPERGPDGFTVADCEDKIISRARLKNEPVDSSETQLCASLYRTPAYVQVLREALTWVQREGQKSVPKWRLREISDRHRLVLEGNESYPPVVPGWMTDVTPTWIQAQIEKIESDLKDPALIKRRSMILQDQVRIAAWKNQNDLNDLTNPTYVVHERQLYDAFYRYYSAKNPGTNACREFKLK